MNELQHLIEEGESEVRELKGPQAPVEVLARQICGMLNQRGGVILWGVTDAKKVVGIDESETRARQLSDFVAQHVRPQPLVSIAPQSVGPRQLVVIDVPAGADKPYSVDREIWIRLGKQTLRASPAETTELVRHSAIQLGRWEREAVPEFSISDCDLEELGATRDDLARSGRFGASVPESDDQLLRHLTLTRGAQLTNACLVLFARQPRRWAPNLALRITSSSGLPSGPMGSDTILEGPAVKIVRTAIDIVAQRTGFSGALEGYQRTDRPAYPTFALREGLVNAVVHRNYAGLGGVQVHVRPDSLVIRNPGALPDGWTARELRTEHASKPVNPDIARTFYLRGLMEQLGTGTQRLIAACKDAGARPPIWTVEKGTVSLTIFRAPTRVTLSPRQRAFIEKRKPGTTFVVHDYVRTAKVSERQARRDLQDLERHGVVERGGRGPATHYRLRAAVHDEAERAQAASIRWHRKNAQTTDRDATKSVDAMVSWFLERYEDPANGVPYNTEEGGYQYIAGGPYNARDELVDAFDDGSPRIGRLIDAATERLEQGGTEWVKRGEY